MSMHLNPRNRELLEFNVKEIRNRLVSLQMRLKNDIQKRSKASKRSVSTVAGDESPLKICGETYGAGVHLMCDQRHGDD